MAADLSTRPSRRVLLIANPDDNDSDYAPIRPVYRPPNPAVPAQSQPVYQPQPFAHPQPSAPPPPPPQLQPSKRYDLPDGRTQQAIVTDFPRQTHPYSNPPLSSPSTSSSPVVESTPPPSTPGQTSLPDFKDIPTSRKELPFSPPAVAPVPPVRNPSARNDKIVIMATTEGDRLTIVDITGAANAAFIREKIFSKLMISDEDQPNYSMYRTEIGSYALGDALTDDELLSLCLERGDEKGTVKLFVNQVHAPVHEPIPTPAIPLPIETQSALTAPLRPKRPRATSRHGSISSASDRNGQDITGSYDASVSDDYDENNHSTMRPWQAVAPGSLPSQPSFPTPSPYNPANGSDIPRSSSPMGSNGVPYTGEPLRIHPERPRNGSMPPPPVPFANNSPRAPEFAAPYEPPVSDRVRHRLSGSETVQSDGSSRNGFEQRRPPYAVPEPQQQQQQAPLPRVPKERPRAARTSDTSVSSQRTARGGGADSPEWPTGGSSSSGGRREESVPVPKREFLVKPSQASQPSPPPLVPQQQQQNKWQKDSPSTYKASPQSSAPFPTMPYTIPQHPRMAPPPPPVAQAMAPESRRPSTGQNVPYDWVTGKMQMQMQRGDSRPVLKSAKSTNDLNNIGGIGSPTSGAIPPNLQPGKPMRQPSQGSFKGGAPTSARALPSPGIRSPQSIPYNLNDSGPRPVLPFSNSTSSMPSIYQGVVSPSNNNDENSPVGLSRRGAFQSRSGFPQMGTDPNTRKSPTNMGPIAHDYIRQQPQRFPRSEPVQNQQRRHAPSVSRGTDSTTVSRSPPRSPVSPRGPSQPPAREPGLYAPTEQYSGFGSLQRKPSRPLLNEDDLESTVKDPSQLAALINTNQSNTDGESTMMAVRRAVPPAQPAPSMPIPAPPQVTVVTPQNPLTPIQVGGWSNPHRRDDTSDEESEEGDSGTLWKEEPHSNQPFHHGAKVDFTRPPAEEMYERLEAFFPAHNLDEPMLDATSGGTSPTTTESPTFPLQPNANGPPMPRRPKKSIRIVAAEGKKRISRVPGFAAGSTAADMLRKRSTKLWGSKLEEVTSAQAQSELSVSAAPDSPSAAAPKPIFKWVRGELIGKGTYGRVYLALNATTGEMIAVKQVEIPRTASDREDTRQVTVVEALKSESETLKDLDHPHIVQYLGFEETPSFLSIFLEYVPGGSVGSCLRKHGKFGENVSKSFTKQILEGLEYLHSKNILHRDLKSDNILVEANGICKISDFGISKRTDAMEQAFTAMQGTVFWMAPEVVQPQGRGYTSKIDIWSVGCVILEMWAGRRPWSDTEGFAVMMKLFAANSAPPVPPDVRLSREAEDFRLLCFKLNPDERPPASQLKCHPYLIHDQGWSFTGDFKS